MANQAHHLAQPFRCTTDRPIVGPLPPEDAKRIAGRYVDSDTILQTALFGVNDGWFDTYWCGQQGGSTAGFVDSVVRRLGSAIVASARRLHLRAVPPFTGIATNTREAAPPLTDAA